MARTIKEDEYIAKRNEILAATQHLIYTKGYERMTIQDILAELKISSGAFYHYFRSKPEVLEGFIERMNEEVEQALLPIVDDPLLPPIAKLQRFFGGLDQLRAAHKTDVIELLRVWYTDDNAIVRQKVEAAVIQRRAPLMAAIVCQGVAEGVFSSAFPEQTGEILLYLLSGMGATHSRLLLSLGQGADEEDCVKAIITTHSAYMDAIERVLGASPNSLARIDSAAVSMWVTALRGNL